MAQPFKLEIVTPDEMFFEGEATLIEFYTQDGEIGVYAGHIPLTTVLAPGIATITTPDGQKQKAALLSGFAEILPNHVRILAESAEWPDQIDKQRAEQAKARAEQRIHSNDKSVDMARAQLALSKAMVRLSLDKR